MSLVTIWLRQPHFFFYPILLSTSLGSHLTKIVTNSSGLLQQYTQEGFDVEDLERDIHFHYESGSPTSACPKGRTSVISLRCDPSQDGQGQF